MSSMSSFSSPFYPSASSPSPPFPSPAPSPSPSASSSSNTTFSSALSPPTFSKLSHLNLPLLKTTTINNGTQIQTHCKCECEPEILDHLTHHHPLSLKSFSLVFRTFRSHESCHRRSLTPLCSSLIPTALSRFPSLSYLNLTLCPSLIAIAQSFSSTLQSIDISRSKNFSYRGMEAIASRCEKLVETDVSNMVGLGG